MKVQANLAAIADQVIVVDDRCWHLCITHATWELAVDIEMLMCSWIMVQDIILQGAKIKGIVVVDSDDFQNKKSKLKINKRINKIHEATLPSTERVLGMLRFFTCAY